MIVEWLMEVSYGFNVWLANLMPPGEVNDASASINGWAVLVQWVAGAGSWVNVPAMTALCAVAISFYIATLLAKFLRVVVSHIPLVGGRG